MDNKRLKSRFTKKWGYSGIYCLYWAGPYIGRQACCLNLSQPNEDEFVPPRPARARKFAVDAPLVWPHEAPGLAPRPCPRGRDVLLGFPPGAGKLFVKVTGQVEVSLPVLAAAAVEVEHPDVRELLVNRQKLGFPPVCDGHVPPVRQHVYLLGVRDVDGPEQQLIVRPLFPLRLADALHRRLLRQRPDLVEAGRVHDHESRAHEGPPVEERVGPRLDLPPEVL